MPKEEIEAEEEIVEEGTPSAQNIIPSEDLKPLMDEVDRILAGSAAGPPADEVVGEETMTEEAVEEGPGEEVVEEASEEEVVEEPAEPGLDLSPLMEALNIEEAQAQALYDAAQQLASLEALEVQEIADALAADFQLRMQVEKIAGSMEDTIAADQAQIGVEADLAAGLPPVALPTVPGAM